MKDELIISKTLLEHQYATMKTKEIQEYYGICSARLYKILDELNIPRRIIRSKYKPYKLISFKD